MLVYICDDSEMDIKLLVRFLGMYAKEMHLSTQISTFEDGDGMLRALDLKVPNIVFIDMVLGKELGCDIARKLRAKDYEGAIIFNSGTGDFVMESYDVSASYYLKKPYTYESFVRAMKSCESVYADEVKYFTYKLRNEQFKISCSDMICVYSDRHIITIKTTDGDHSFTGVINQLEEELSGLTNSFERIGQSYIINRNHIKDFDKSNITMDNGMIIAIPVRKRKDILERLNSGE